MGSKTGDHLIKKGQVLNPKGRGKGVISIKNRIKEYYIANPEALNKAIEYLATNDKQLSDTWKMLEGAPKQQTDVTVQQPKPILPSPDALQALKASNVIDIPSKGVKGA